MGIKKIKKLFEDIVNSDNQQIQRKYLEQLPSSIKKAIMDNDCDRFKGLISNNHYYLASERAVVRSK